MDLLISFLSSTLSFIFRPMDKVIDGGIGFQKHGISTIYQVIYAKKMRPDRG